MKSLIALLLTTGSLAFASPGDQCELRLKTSIAIVTARALEQGKLKVEQVQAMADSETALNPLQTVRPRTDAGPLKIYYQTVLAQAHDWQAVRAELRQVLQHHQGRAVLKQQAREATATVVAPQEISLPEVCGPCVKNWLKTKDNRLYYSYVDESNHEYQVRDFATHEPIWSGSLFDMAGSQGLEEAANGDIQFATLMRAMNNLSRWERWRYKGLDRYQRRVINTRTRNVVEDYYFFPAGVGFYSLHRAPYGPDIVKMPGSTGYFPLTRKKPPQQFTSRARVKVFRGNDGRNLILSKDMDQAGDFTIFAPKGKAYEPWITLPFALGSRAYIEAAQLRDGRFVFAAKDQPEGGPNRLVYFPPSRDGGGAEQDLRYPFELIRQEILVTTEEKILVAAWLREGFNRYFALYEPARSLDPIFLIGGGNTRPQEFAYTEVDGRLLMMVTTNSSQFQLYEPLLSSNAMVEIATGDTASSFGLLNKPDGQIYFYFAGHERLRAFALMNVTRSK